MRLTIIGIAVAGLLWSIPAQACRQLTPNAKVEYSDVVVVGEAYCLETPGKCRLVVEQVLKGQDRMTLAEIEISVTVPPPERTNEDGRFSFGRCPQTFEPWQETIRGRFYLKVQQDGSLFAAHPIDVRGETSDDFDDRKSE